MDIFNDTLEARLQITRQGDKQNKSIRYRKYEYLCELYRVFKVWDSTGYTSHAAYPASPEPAVHASLH